VSLKNIVVLACFSDHWDGSGGTVLASKGRVASEYTDLFNEVGHTSDGAVGSVRDYYAEVSYGKLTIQTVVTPWVLLPQNEAYYGDNATGNNQLMVIDAIAAAEAAGFDFSQGDSDSDGWVDCLTIVHSGHGEEVSGNPSTLIWSHKSSITKTTYDGASMSKYHTEPALRGSTSSTSIIRIGVICHELGHFFGLPDLYDYSGITSGLGRWCLMAGGSWNGSSGASPAHFSAWCKAFLGFANPVPVHSLSGLSLDRVEDNPDIKLVRDGTSNGEYFLVENRAKFGFDNSSSIYPGIVIYHVDSKSRNNDLGTWDHPAVKIEEADGDDSIGSKVASSEAGDVWTSTSGLAGGFRDQTANTGTSAMLYQSGSYYTRTDSAASYTYNTLNNFSAAGATMTCDLTSLRSTLSDQTNTTSGFTVSWPACSGATKYEIEEGVTTTVTSFSDGAEDEDAMYENWYLSGAVNRDSDGKNSGTYSYSMLYSDASVQAMVMRKRFKVTTSTVVSYNVMSHISSGDGYIKCQMSTDDGDTWQTLGSDDGYINTWPSRSFNYAAINAQGINADDMCILRFVMNVDYGNGWSSFPAWGFAVDDISITDIEMDGYTGWTSLDNNVAANSYGVTGKTSGTYAYRVRAFSNGAWQDYSSEGEVTVNLPGGSEDGGWMVLFR
jgi:immune inhibitor A